MVSKVYENAWSGRLSARLRGRRSRGRLLESCGRQCDVARVFPLFEPEPSSSVKCTTKVPLASSRILNKRQTNCGKSGDACVAPSTRLDYIPGYSLKMYSLAFAMCGIDSTFCGNACVAEAELGGGFPFKSLPKRTPGVRRCDDAHFVVRNLQSSAHLVQPKNQSSNFRILCARWRELPGNLPLMRSHINYSALTQRWNRRSPAN